MSETEDITQYNRTSKMAVASVLFGILGILILVLSIPG